MPRGSLSGCRQEHPVVLRYPKFVRAGCRSLARASARGAVRRCGMGNTGKWCGHWYMRARYARWRSCDGFLRAPWDLGERADPVQGVEAGRGGAMQGGAWRRRGAGRPRPSPGTDTATGPATKAKGIAASAGQARRNGRRRTASLLLKAYCVVRTCSHRRLHRHDLVVPVMCEQRPDDARSRSPGPPRSRSCGAAR
jgi:hypothetical protein